MREWFATEIVKLGQVVITYGTISSILAICIGAWLVLKIIKRLIFRIPRFSSGQKQAFYQLFQYVIFIASILFSFQLVGLNWGFVLAGSAALLVGVGLGLQNLFNDFMSGIIILLDGTIQVNNIIQLDDGTIGKIYEMRLRSTTVKDRDGRHVIVPNHKFTVDNVINWTIETQTNRMRVVIGVDYGSDLEVTRNILVNAAKSHKACIQDPEPIARIIDFADSAIVFELLYWTRDIFFMDNHKADIRWNVAEEFRKQGVTIPFPQRTVHMAKPK